MNIGVSTACYYPLETEISLEKIGLAGIDTAEVFFNARSELKPPFIDILKNIKEQYGIRIPSIHPTFSLAESFMIFSNYERRFYEALDEFARYSEIAAELGAKYIILHGGKNNGILTDEEYCEKYMLLKEQTLKNSVTILQENVFKYRAGDIEFLRSMQNILKNDAEFCIDIKQSLRCGYPPVELIEEFSQNIRHYHISDNSPASDCLLPGNGNFNFKSFFELIKNTGYNGDCIIEVYSNSYHDYSEISDSYKKLIKNI